MSEVSVLVDGEIARRFDARSAPRVREVLRRTTLPFLDAPDRTRERDRVQLAILKLAAGDARAVELHAGVAASDWRDVLVAAGLGHSDWESVLEAAGFPVP